MRVLAHIAVIVVALGVLVGLPTALNANLGMLFASGADTVSSATTIQAAPSGTYTVLVNGDRHPDGDVLAEWKRFFHGDDVGVIMEDLSCVALVGDAPGIEMAESLQSRLPENQMTLRLEDATLALSKAEVGKFDVIVMSDEAAESFGASTLYGKPGVEVVHR